MPKDQAKLHWVVARRPHRTACGKVLRKTVRRAANDGEFGLLGDEGEDLKQPYGRCAMCWRSFYKVYRKKKA